ncbi:MAG: permease, partial [Fibrobacterales bacterium]|nr:permease [Fibrobacterales bacterium]
MTSLLAEFARQFFLLLAQMAPWLLLGFLLAGILHVWVPSRLYVPKLSGRSFKSVLLATLFGIPLPICSCGTMPTAVALRREGAGKGACVGFLISTPATGADSILATWSLLGLPFALLRPVAAFLTALFGGALANFLTRGEPEETPGNAQETLSGAKGAHASLREKLRETLRYGFVEMVGNIGKWLFVGLLLGALVATAVPDGF